MVNYAGFHSSILMWCYLSFFATYFAGVIWKGDSLIEGVPETLDMLRAKVWIWARPLPACVYVNYCIQYVVFLAQALRLDLLTNLFREKDWFLSPTTQLSLGNSMERSLKHLAWMSTRLVHFSCFFLPLLAQKLFFQYS